VEIVLRMPSIEVGSSETIVVSASMLRTNSLTWR
jgi:hypothetical protein